MYLSNLQEYFVIVPTDKASNNFPFISKHYYISKTLTEVHDTYKQSAKEDILNKNVKFSKKFRLKSSDTNNNVLKMHIAHVSNFRIKRTFYSTFNKFWLIKNQVNENQDKINKKKFSR